MEIYITHVLDTGTAFGVRTSDGSNVFIPAHVMKDGDLSLGALANCRLVPNSKQPERTPWLAVEATLMGEAPDKVVDDTPSVYDIVHEGGVWTTNRVYQELYEGAVDTKCDEYKAVSNELYRLHKVGELSISKLYRTADQEQASIVLFATKYEDLLVAA